MFTRLTIELPSALFRRQIRNITYRMDYFIDKMIFYPLHNMTAFNKASRRFAEVKDEAYLCCSVMDGSQSIEKGERATNATLSLMGTLVELKNEVTALIKNNTK